jgi:plasmid stability protein
MADILIRKVNEKTKERLRQRAERRGKSLEADLRDTLEKLARDETTPEDDAPFGTWLFEISRPGADMSETFAEIRSAKIRKADFS